VSETWCFSAGLDSYRFSVCSVCVVCVVAVLVLFSAVTFGTAELEALLSVCLYNIHAHCTVGAA
jgi:hypothetical protein